MTITNKAKQTMPNVIIFFL